MGELRFERRVLTVERPVDWHDFRELRLLGEQGWQLDRRVLYKDTLYLYLRRPTVPITFALTDVLLSEQVEETREGRE